MKRAISGLGVIARLSDRAIPYALLTVLVPLLVLAGFGLYGILRDGHVIAFIATLLGCTVLASVGLLLARRALGKTMGPAVEHALQASPKVPAYWRERDRQVQRDTLADLAELLKQQPAWQALPNHGLAVVRLVAGQYNGNARNAHWAFTAPELLAITEQVSRRYRRVIRAHVPGVEHIRLSTLMALNDQVERYGPLAMKLFNGYRALRLFSPQGVLAEVLTQLRGEVFSGLSDELQNRLKYLLLLEVLRAAIDLYGGHLRVDDEQLRPGKVAVDDEKRQAPPLDPVRIGLLGQVGAGKSSLVNALTASLGAEVSALPATEGVTVYTCAVDGAPDLRLVDLPGLDGSEKVQRLLFEQVCQCDLVLWVLKANQPARALDTALRQQLDAWFSQPKHVDHQPPILLGVLNHVDRLLPTGAWPEHFALGDGSQAAKIVADALAYNQQLLTMAEWVPLAMPPGKPPFNLDGLRDRLQEHYAQAVNVQLNRRRREAGDFSIGREMQRVRKAAVGLFGLLR